MGGAAIPDGNASAPALMRDVLVPEVPDALRASFETLRDASLSPALRAFREAAWSAFEELGIPGTKHEDFSYLSAADLKFNLTRLPPPSGSAEVEGVIRGSGAFLDFVDGRLTSFDVPAAIGLHGFAEGDMPESLATAWTRLVATENEAPAAQAWAFAPQPLALHVPRDVKVTIDLRFSGAYARADHALLIRLEEGAEAAVAIESDLGAEAFFNAAIAFSLAPGARLRVLQEDAPQGVQMLKLRFAVEKDARAELLAVSTGSRLARIALEADLLASGAEVDLRGAAALAGSNRAHRHIRLRHAAPDCNSKQLFKAVVPAAGRSSVDGTVIVDRGAQRTDARQLLQHLLLSPDGRADAKPRLLIHADDVKCSHGATVGKTDPAQKFYLLSRGLDAATADRLLTQAFLGEALELFADDTRIRERLMDAVTGASAASTSKGGSK